MPPRRAAAAGDEDQCPVLKLIMEKGPLTGQTNDFRPGLRIQIGRVARGNTLSIKDAGISSKHLLIQAEAVLDPGRRCWTITDLGSSNGTFLNGKQLEKSEPAVLSNGDVIKIGEQTSIKVKFEVSGRENEANSRNVGRNTRRRVRNPAGELGIIDEDSELRLGDKYLGNENNLGIGIRNETYEDLGNEGERLGIVNEQKTRGRRTRGSVAREFENGDDEVKMESMGLASLRRTRSSKKEENLQTSIIELDEDNEKSEKAAEVEVKHGRNVSRTRSSKNSENMPEDLNINGNNDLGPSGVKGGQRMSVRRTRSSRKEEHMGEALIDLDVIEGKRTMKGRRGRKKLPVETPLAEQKNEENLETSIIELDDDKGKSEKVAEVEVKQGRNVSVSSTRSSKNNENMPEDLNINADKDLGPGQRMSVRSTRSSRKEEHMGEVLLDLNVIEDKRTMKGRRGRKKLPVETPFAEQKKEESNLEHKICEEEKRKSDVGVSVLVERVNSGREGAAGLASTSGVKESVTDVGKGKVVADLEKMTLGEWFEFLEVFLPKQIIDATEEMISEMRQKAERLQEFLLQQKNAKENGEMAAD